MGKLDFSPFFERCIGMDNIIRMLDSSISLDENASYPPYNIIKDKNSEEHYRIEMAIAGFSKHDIEIKYQDGSLIVSASSKNRKDESEYLYKGISNRGFKKVFTLADSIKVIGADFKEGMLIIRLEKEIPEAKKPRLIEIS